MHSPENAGCVPLQTAVITSFTLKLHHAHADTLNNRIAWFDEIVCGEPTELEALAQNDDKALSAIAVHMGNRIGLTASAFGQDLLVQGNGDINLPGFAALLQAFFPGCLPAHITWAAIGPVCTGGWMIVEEASIHQGNASEVLNQTAKDLAQDGAPSEIQLAAAQAYSDRDDGMLLDLIQEGSPLVRQTLTSPSFGDLLGAYIWAECSDAEDMDDAAHHLQCGADALSSIADAMRVGQNI